jgi:UDP-glucuronate 4-epimerase
MSVLVTGVAGFIGFHLAKALLARGVRIIGVDNVNDYYEVSLKEARLKELEKTAAQSQFVFRKLNIADRVGMFALVNEFNDIETVAHLAAQAGVRFSLVDPYAYVESNVMGQVVMLEAARKWPRLKHFVYASSSSVYGSNTNVPFGVDDPVEQPTSLYAATKRADELIARTYAHLYQIPSTGLRFFTVYGPWGRPDMAAFLFTKAILAGEPIRVFNHGNLERDFTYIDDIVDGVMRAMERVPKISPPHVLYNLGNSKPERLPDFIATLEKALGKQAIQTPDAMQLGDVKTTYADISTAQRDLGYSPKTPISVGIPKFVEWYRGYYGI